MNIDDYLHVIRNEIFRSINFKDNNLLINQIYMLHDAWTMNVVVSLLLVGFLCCVLKCFESYSEKMNTKNWEKFKTSVRRPEWIWHIIIIHWTLWAYRIPTTGHFNIIYKTVNIFNVFVLITLSMAAYKICSTASWKMIELCFHRNNNLNLRQMKRFRCGYPIIKR